MSVPSVTVSGVLNLPSGLPLALASIRFTLSNPGLRGVTVVVPIATRATTDASGFFSIKLSPNTKNTYYTVTIYRSTGVVILETVAVIPNTDCQFSQVIQTGQPTTLTAAVIALEDLKVAQANIEVVRLGVIATAAATNSSSQASLAKFKTTVDGQLEAAEARIERARIQVLDTAEAANLDSKVSLIKLKTSVDTYERLIASTESTVAGVVDSAIGTSFDLVTAYQLSL